MENMDPFDPLYGIEENDQEGVLTIVAKDGTKKVENVSADKATYLNMFDAVYATIREGSPYPITAEQIKTQLEILC